MADGKLIGLLNKRQAFVLASEEGDITGDFRIISTEQEAKAMADAKEELIKDRLFGDAYWMSYYEDCAVLALAMVQGERQIYGSARLLRASLSRQEVDYLAQSYKDFLKAVMPKFDELDDKKADELIHDFLAQTKNPTE